MQMSRLESIIMSDQKSDHERNIISFLGHLFWINFMIMKKGLHYLQLFDSIPPCNALLYINTQYMIMSVLSVWNEFLKATICIFVPLFFRSCFLFIILCAVLWFYSISESILWLKSNRSSLMLPSRTQGGHDISSSLVSYVDYSSVL